MVGEETCIIVPVKTPLSAKSSIGEIKERFEEDVDRFSSLETGQEAIPGARVMLELLSTAAHSLCPAATHLLDIGAGAGNNAIKIARKLPGLHLDLVDLSPRMLERAKTRLGDEDTGEVRLYEGDFRDISLEQGRYDIIVAAAVFHHLRDDRDWENTMAKVYGHLKEGGAFLVSDMIGHEIPQVHDMMWEAYGDYLVELRDEEYRDEVFLYIDKEDSPRPLGYQFELLKRVGFRGMEILYKNSCFAAYAAVK